MHIIERNYLHEGAEGSVEARGRRKSAKAVEGVVWTEAGRKRLVHGNDEDVHQGVGF